MEGPKPKQFQHPPITELLDEINGIFKEPTKLPPTRSFDHKINLTERAKPICIRPYKYPYYQKEEIEKLVGEMLTS
jgi:hypothetical protein